LNELKASNETQKVEASGVKRSQTTEDFWEQQQTEGTTRPTSKAIPGGTETNAESSAQEHQAALRYANDNRPIRARARPISSVESSVADPDEVTSSSLTSVASSKETRRPVEKKSVAVNLRVLQKEILMFVDRLQDMESLRTVHEMKRRYEKRIDEEVRRATELEFVLAEERHKMARIKADLSMKDEAAYTEFKRSTSTESENTRLRQEINKLKGELAEANTKTVAKEVENNVLRRNYTELQNSHKAQDAIATRLERMMKTYREELADERQENIQKGLELSSAKEYAALLEGELQSLKKHGSEERAFRVDTGKEFELRMMKLNENQQKFLAQWSKVVKAQESSDDLKKQQQSELHVARPLSHMQKPSQKKSLQALLSPKASGHLPGNANQSSNSMPKSKTFRKKISHLLSLERRHSGASNDALCDGITAADESQDPADFMIEKIVESTEDVITELQDTLQELAGRNHKLESYLEAANKELRALKLLDSPNVKSHDELKSFVPRGEMAAALKQQDEFTRTVQSHRSMFWNNKKTRRRMKRGSHSTHSKDSGGEDSDYAVSDGEQPSTPTLRSLSGKSLVFQQPGVSAVNTVASEEPVKSSAGDGEGSGVGKGRSLSDVDPTVSVDLD